MPEEVVALWERSRHGSHAGRGFRYQDAVATDLAVRAWRGDLPIRRLVPEGLDDISLELERHPLHLQAKSRRTHRGDFTVGELSPAWRHLAERIAADPTSHAALVLERPLRVAETGFDGVLADVRSAELKASVAAAVRDVLSPDKFLARTHLVIMPASATDGVGLIAERLALPPATCVAHHSVLRAELGRLAEENGVRTPAAAAGLTVGEIARLIDEVTESVDPSALEEAVRGGVCELVDFSTPIVDEHFYGGVDVVVGHVVAGQPLERPEFTEALAAGLFERRVALAVGPSGTGKSALIWLTAYDTRHLLRWYRMRRLREEDVPAVVRLVKGLEPTTAPVGFVVDDIGRDDRAGFDLLVDELRTRPGAFVVGACREEDLVVVRNAHQAVQVRPLLEEELAERIWRELRVNGGTAWAEWREPYERSDGLLLEFGHLLTEGTRLEETIRSQVERRVLENRAIELDVLTLVATADAFGAEVDAARLASALGVEVTAMKNALARLVAEHLVAERDGMLGGLHELRSRQVVLAVHRLPPPTLGHSVGRVVDLLAGDSLQPFITRLLLEEVVPDEEAIDVLTRRLERDPDPWALAAALQALRLVSFRRMARHWGDIFAEEDASATDVGVIGHLSLHGGDVDFLPEPIKRAVARIRELQVIDLRAPLLTKIARQIPAALATASDIKTTAIALAALGEVGQSVPIDPARLARLVNGTSLEDLRLLLEASYAASPDLAIAVVEALGGSDVLLARLEAERPWVRGARVGVNEEGRPTAEADYAFVAESVQPNPHDAVVELARYLAAFAPAAEVAVCRAIDAAGRTAGFGGVAIADKAIDRRNLPSQAELAWNRARGRAAIASVAAATETDHLLAACEIAVQAARLVRRAGDVWARGQKATRRLVSDATALAEAAHNLRPRPIAIETAGPLDEGVLPLADPASFVGTLIANNLFVNLFKGERVAPLIPQIIQQVDELAKPERWRLLREPPSDDVAALRKALVDLHAAVAESARGDRAALMAVRAAGKRGLAAAARAARHRAEKRMEALAEELKVRLGGAAFAARVWRRPGEPDSYRWPSDEFLVLVEIATIYDWQRHLENLAALCRPLLADRIGFYMAPIRNGRIVTSFAVKVIEGIFPTEDIRGWRDLPLPVLDEQLGDVARRGFAALHEASGIIASIRRDELHDEEVAALEAATAQAHEALEYAVALATETSDQLVIEVGGTLLDVGQRVENEAAVLRRGEHVTRSVAESFLAGLDGHGDDVFFAQVGAAAACAEWDVDPDSAWARFQAAFESEEEEH